MKQYVYVLQSIKDGKRYIGLTNDITRRIREHNNGNVPATKGRTPFVIVRLEEFDKRSDAARREKFLKSGVGRKELKQLLDS